MSRYSPLIRGLFLLSCLMPAVGLSAGAAAVAPLPPESAIAKAGPGVQRLLLAPLDGPAGIETGGWQLSEASVAPAPAGVAPRVGTACVLLRGKAAGAGSKGDFPAAQSVPGTCRFLGVWVYLAPEANVARVGFQVYDAQGEALLSTVPADWQGWRWLEVDVALGDFAPAYPQADKNGKVDSPLRSVNLVWFAKAAGETGVVVDGLVAATELPAAAGAGALTAGMGGPETGEPGRALSLPLFLTNHTEKALTASVEYSLQRDPALFDREPPDPVWGSDHALGARSWTEVDGQRLEEGSLTDGKPWTAAETPWNRAHYAEAFQFVDLGQVRRVTHLGYRAGDANWVWKVDVSASTDGQTFQPVAGLQEVDLHGKWAQQAMDVPQPFSARVIRLRYHNDGQKSDVIRMPSAFSVYDGTADETWAFPQTGEVIASGKSEAPVPARAFAALTAGSAGPLSTGSYLLAVRVRAGASVQLLYHRFFVMPAALKTVSAESRFGLNSSTPGLAPMHRRLGVGWVRFENLKWPMVSPEPGVFRYDGSVAPWHVNVDGIVEGNVGQGIQVLPYLFLTPEYATTAGAEVKKQRLEYPPKENAQYAEFCFQTAARYGSAKHPAEALRTPDRRSGLGLMHVFELWNEPSLNNPDWGAFIAPLPQYFEMFRAGAEAVKRADPSAKVTNAGWAGIDVASIDPLRSYTYADGKRPLDFMDVLNVHCYTGRTPPELASINTNENRHGEKQTGPAYPENLRALAEWRDRHKPGLPIWLTETGYDTGGPWGVSERLQAAWLPRDVMLALANGMEKVFVYRESGSTDSLYAASGLMRNDHSLKPSWFTYATLIRELDGARGGLRVPTRDANARVYAWTRGAETILSAWAVEGTARLDANLGRCRVVDAFGGGQEQDGTHGLTLSAFPVYLRAVGDGAALKQLLEAARRAEADRRAAREREAKRRAYLFDFGGSEHVGTLDLGGTRFFTAVLARETFDAARGYGFQPRAAMQDDDQAWRADPLERDSCRLGPGLQFAVGATPGRYHLRVGVEPFGTGGQFTVKGVVGGERKVDVTRQAAFAEMEVEVGSTPLTVEMDGYANLRWLTLIEKTIP